jgi:hypothetical protein
MSRTTPAEVSRQLAAEVGHGCPVEGCGSPFLMWHHFDPPWAERHHFEPGGMVALCPSHHSAADGGAFTIEQLRELKRVGRDRSLALAGRFDWMREELLAVIGGNFFYRVPIAVRFGEHPVVWFNRRAGSNDLLLNLVMPTVSGTPRMLMTDNEWVEASGTAEIVCPPSGHLVRAKYPGGDELRVRFRELPSIEELDRRYPPPKLPKDIQRRLEAAGIPLPEMTTTHAEPVQRLGISFPIAAVEVRLKIAGTPYDFGPRTTIEGSMVSGAWIAGVEVGLQIG